jgi:hypothetical protein
MSQFSKSQLFSTAGATTFTAPAGTTMLWITASGAGGGGGGSFDSGSIRSGGQAGGSGEYCGRVPMPITSGETINLTVGTGGAGGTGVVNANGANGTATTITGTLFSLSLAGGGGGCDIGLSTQNGRGGGWNGAGPTVGLASGVAGSAEGLCVFGGSSGAGQTSNGQVAPSGAGGSCASWLGGNIGLRVLHGGVFFNAGGAGAAASIFGSGPNGGAGETAGIAATSPGAGGSGAGGANATGSSFAGGKGADGGVLIEWESS